MPNKFTIANAMSAAAALSLLALAGCNQIDPLTRPYLWHPSDVNAHNIAAQAANPADLVHGRESPRHQVNTDSDAADRLWSGKPLPLLTSGGSGGGSGAAAPSTGGGP
jgi:type IV pilus biogenesis protein CpaD/CtpE